MLPILPDASDSAHPRSPSTRRARNELSTSAGKGLEGRTAATRIDMLPSQPCPPQHQPRSPPLPALSLGEVLATSDVPGGGVVNVLSGRTTELAPPLASHQDVNAIDLAGADEVLAKELEIAAADNLKRVLRPQPMGNWTATPGIDRLTAFLETKTVWHPTGSLGASNSSY